MSEALKRKILLLAWITGILVSSTSSMPFIHAYSDTSLTITIPSPPPGIPFSSECTIEATLKDEEANPVPNMDIEFFFCGNEKFGTATTDANGVAALTYTFTSAGAEVMAKFSGTSRFAPSRSEYLDFVIVDYTPYIAGGALITVIAISAVVYIIYRRRK